MLIQGITHAQITSFTLSTTPTAQTCAGNGQVVIDISGTQAGAEFEFVIYQLPNTVTPIRTVSGIPSTGMTLSHTEGTLTTSNYRLVATQSLDVESNSQTADFVIGNNVQSLSFTYTLTNSCLGQNIAINVSQGNPSYYELRSPSNVLIRPAQTTPIFNDVPEGNYNLVVTDVCGNSFTLSAAVTYTPGTYFLRTSNTTLGFTNIIDCNTMRRQIAITSNGGAIESHRFPIIMKFEIENPLGGPNTIINQTWTSTANNSQYFNFPYYEGYTYNFITHLEDACGEIYNKTEQIVGQPNVRVQSLPALCGTKYIFLDQLFRQAAPMTLTFTSYPSSFDPADYNSSFIPGDYTATFNTIPNSISFSNATSAGVPEGSYTFNLTVCGITTTRTIVVTNNVSYSTRVAHSYASCDEGRVQ